MGFFDGLKNLAQKGIEKGKEFAQNVNEEKEDMAYLSKEELLREYGRGSFTHIAAAFMLLKESYGMSDEEIKYEFANRNKRY